MGFRYHGATDSIQLLLNKFQGFFYTYQELVTLAVQLVDICFTVETSVHNEFNLIQIQEINISKYVGHGRYVLDIAW